MSRQSPASPSCRSIAAFALVGTLAIGVLAACGHEPPQSKEHASIAGINASVGTIAIRNIQVTLGANGNATITGAFFDQGTEPDSLIAVSSTSAQSGQLPTGEVLDLKPGEGVFLTTTSTPIVLVGVKGVRVGANIPIELSFQAAGRATLLVPVVAEDPTLRVGPTPTPTTSVTPGASTTATPTATPATTPGPTTAR